MKIPFIKKEEVVEFGNHKIYKSYADNLKKLAVKMGQPENFYADRIGVQNKKPVYIDFS